MCGNTWEDSSKIHHTSLPGHRTQTGCISGSMKSDSGGQSYLPSTAAHTTLQFQSQGYQPSSNGSSPTGLDVYHTKTDSTSNTKHARLQATVIKLQAQVTQKQQDLDALCSKLSARSSNKINEEGVERLAAGNDEQEAVLKHAQRTVTQHIKLLHRYNEIKDVGMGLLGLIADMEGKRLAEVMAERGLSEKD